MKRPATLLAIIHSVIACLLGWILISIVELKTEVVKLGTRLEMHLSVIPSASPDAHRADNSGE